MTQHQQPPQKTNDDELVTRVTTYLKRHIAWLQETLKELESIKPTQSTQEIEEQLQKHQQRDQQLQHLHREHHALLREWKAAQDLPPEHLANVRNLAADAESLTQRLKTQYEELVTTLNQTAKENNQALRETRQGRDLLNTYRPRNDHLSGFIDKKA